jgi:hypothetical protein
MARDSSFAVYYRGPTGLRDAELSLRNASWLEVRLDGESLVVRARRGKGPALHVGLNDEPHVALEARELAERRGCYDLARCDRRFEVGFDDLEAVLDESNTLAEVQDALQNLIGGTAHLAWNGELCPPRPPPAPPWTKYAPPGTHAQIVDAGPTRFVDLLNAPLQPVVTGEVFAALAPALARLPATAHVSFVVPHCLADAVAKTSFDTGGEWWKHLRAAVPPDAVATCYLGTTPKEFYADDHAFGRKLAAVAERFGVLLAPDWPCVLAVGPEEGGVVRPWTADEVLGDALDTEPVAWPP